MPGPIIYVTKIQPFIKAWEKRLALNQSFELTVLLWLSHTLTQSREFIFSFYPKKNLAIFLQYYQPGSLTVRIKKLLLPSTCGYWKGSEKVISLVKLHYSLHKTP